MKGRHGMVACNANPKTLAAYFILAMCAMTISCAGESRTCSDSQNQANQTVSEQLACIYDLVNSPSVVLVPEALKGSSTTYRAAIGSLIESDYLIEVETLNPAPAGLPTMDRSVTGYYPTAEGMEYLYSHRHPVKSWLSENWFPLTVAVVSSLIGIGTVLVGWTTRKSQPAKKGRR